MSYEHGVQSTDCSVSPVCLRTLGPGEASAVDTGGVVGGGGGSGDHLNVSGHPPQ